jgi:hypothetical protein
MNDRQRKTLIAVGAIVLGMLLFPPYRVYGGGSHSNTVIKTGYAFIFELPARATVDVATLLVQWVGVLIVGAIAFFLQREK